jgi:hypothetical protein
MQFKVAKGDERYRNWEGRNETSFFLNDMTFYAEILKNQTQNLRKSWNNP